MKGAVKIVTNKPGSAQKAVGYADIKGQGRIPYGKTADAPMAKGPFRKMTMRGTGAAIKGKSFMGC